MPMFTEIKAGEVYCKFPSKDCFVLFSENQKLECLDDDESIVKLKSIVYLFLGHFKVNEEFSLYADTLCYMYGGKAAYSKLDAYDKKAFVKLWENISEEHKLEFHKQREQIEKFIREQCMPNEVTLIEEEVD